MHAIGLMRNKIENEAIGQKIKEEGGKETLDSFSWIIRNKDSKFSDPPNPIHRAQDTNGQV